MRRKNFDLPTGWWTNPAKQPTARPHEAWTLLRWILVGAGPRRRLRVALSRRDAHLRRFAEPFA